ncbi:MAG: LamG domain-containing protein [Candidatus Poribacteria bacterium]|nr:LamG domain-containing protein [Candidatus Poribacteria bacterium]
MKLAICLSIALLLMATPLVMSIGPAEFLDGLVLYHPYDEGKGAKAEDLSENEHEGVIDNPKWVNGKFGKALEFGGPGSDVFVTVESTAKLNVDEFSFMAWINSEEWNGVRQIVGKSVHGGCGGRVQYGVFSEGGVFKIRLETESGRADIATDLPETGEFVHIAFTNDTKKTKIYYDGKEVQEGDTPGKLKANDDPWRVGQDCDRLQYVFAGIIDEVRLWNRALSEDEINTFMDQGVEALAVEATGKLSTTWSRLKAGL